MSYIRLFITHKTHSALLTSDVGTGLCRYYYKLALLSSYQVSLYCSFISVMNTGEVIKSNVIFINFEWADLCYTWKVINVTWRLIERLTITIHYCSSVMSKEQSHALPVDNSVSCMMQPFKSAERERVCSMQNMAMWLSHRALQWWLL